MDTAPYKIAELLKHQDDLDKISEIKQRLLREKATFDGQLKTGVQQQIQVLSHGTQSLADAKLKINQVRDDMIKIQKLKIDSQESVENFEKISRLSKVLKNFEDTTKFLNNFKNMPKELADIQLLIDEDGEFSFESSLRNMLVIHYKLDNLRNIKDDALFHTKSSTEDVKRTISRHFAQLDKVIERFDKILFEIAENLLEILRTGDSSVIVRVGKIIYFEESQDLIAVTQGQSIANNLLFKNNTSNRIPREYLSRFYSSIENSIIMIFDNCMEAYPPEEDPDLLLENLSWIYHDLEDAKNLLTKCLPEKWKILDKFVQYYQKQTYRLINKIMSSEPTASTILHILDFVKEYYDVLKNEIGYKKDQLTPLLLDGKEDALYDDYLNLIITKLNEWYNNISKTEKEPFIIRSSQPQTTSSDDIFGMEGEGLIFTLITQQIDVAASSGQGRILTGCIEECANILRDRQKEWKALMKQEVEKDLNDVVDETGNSSIPPGLYDYLMALANDQIKGADFTEAISSRRTQELSKKYSSQVKNVLEDVCDGFIEVAKSCIQGMIQLIFNDLAQPFKEIFDKSSWYKGHPLGQISATLNEYIADSKKHQHPLVFEVFIEDLIKETILHYLYALNNCQHALKVPKATDRIKLDIEVLYVLFIDPQLEISEEIIQDHFKIFEHLLETLSSPIPELPSQFQLLRQNFWDAPLDLFEKMVSIRKDIDSKLAKEIMIKVRNEALQTDQENEGQQPTYLSKYQTKR